MLISQAFIRKPNILASGACLKRLLNIPAESYLSRHIGPRPNDIKDMLKTVGFKSIDEFVEASMPSDVLVKRKLNIIPADGFSEQGALDRLKQLAGQNKVVKSLIGRGYYGTITPSVILRSVLENPNWYTSYTPYQPEISQGRLESLFNFQTVICDLTGMEIANASLLDEATAAAEAMSFSFHHSREKKPKFLVDTNLFEQTVDVIKTRAQLIGVQVEQTDLSKVQKIDSDVCGVLLGYPSADGSINDWKPLADLCKQSGALVSVAADLLALAIMEPPKYADVVVGTSQRLGVPMGFGGPHAGYFATKNAFSRKIPGRIIGISKDKYGDQAYRLALQTREQHIRREKATSNICTAQALLANITAMYAVYHGPQGLKDIATKIHLRTRAIASLIGESLINRTFFDTLSIKCENSVNLQEVFLKAGFNIHVGDAHTISISLDESLTDQEFEKLYKLMNDLSWGSGSSCAFDGITAFRESNFLQYPVFNSHHSETDMLRYISKLQSKDFSLAQGMIPLGSCTMKLNAATAMIPITWPEFANIHPFAPQDQTYGYLELIKELENDLSEITGFAATSLQPNSGAQGEFSGLRAIRLYLDSIGETGRNICLIPVSAHGTNPASASLAGMKIVSVKCLTNGELDLKDLEAKADKHAAKLAAMMITYPSTYGVYEPGIRKAISIIHNHGGQVYMDGANMNAQVGLTSPGDLGADVCHLNLHKTFSIPHGGGGPGVGPICVKEHLAPFLPNHSVKKVRSNNLTSVSAAPYGSALVLPISWSYIKMLGPEGLKTSSEVAMLNANYLMKRLEPYYEVVFKNSNGLCAHEFIMNLGNFKNTSGVQTIDIAKRLQDYGFHAPTMSWPVPNTLMIEPTESESKQELDRFVDALISIRQEIADIEAKKVPYENGVLANAPHTTKDLLSTEWDRPYTREQAAFPVSGLKQFKFWPASARVDDTYGDKHLICSCGSVENYTA